MNDSDFEAALGAAFQTPIADPARRDVTSTVLQRLSSDSRSRAGVLAAAALLGVAIAASALVATRLAGPILGWALRIAGDLKLDVAGADPTPFVIVGLVLTGLAVARNAIRDL